MADIKSPEARSRNMAAIHGKNTKPEQYIRRLLFAEGYRYRKNVNYVFGHPDLYFAKYNTAIFIHGCFWHRHFNCKYAYLPKTRTDFWTEKFEHNVERDKTVQKQLRSQGIRCMIIWECTVKKMKKDCEVRTIILNTICSFLNGTDMFIEV